MKNSSAAPLFVPDFHAAHAERVDRQYAWWETKTAQFYGSVSSLWQARLHHFKGLLEGVHRHSEGLKNLSDANLRLQAQALRLPFRAEGIDSPERITEAFALIRESAGRVVGMRHFDSQLLGGAILLAGNVAEMATGEGKTLTATLAAGAAAIAGLPTHVVTANDYLSERDFAEMAPVYQLLGLTVGSVSANTEQEQRREQYLQDITYCTNKDVAFDYLRDAITLGGTGKNVRLQSEALFKASRSQQLTLRGLHFAIVDEADSVLIDDARTPLIISANSGGEEEELFLQQAYKRADELLEGDDYKVDPHHKSITLSEDGCERLSSHSSELGALWLGRVRREEVIRQALAVKHFYQLDHDYVVADGKVQIVDENTGRILPDRSWERGLHQLVEIKEGCDVTKQRETLARISYQRFFRRYLRLGGMTGTAKEVKRELWDFYRLRVVAVPTHKPLQRKFLAPLVAVTETQHHEMIIDRIQELQEKQQPVLVGTSSVAASEHISQSLHAKGIDHQLLNAKQDNQESQIIAGAGKSGAVTVATQMAGRGTDIKLDAKAAELAGLTVLLTMRGEAARVDRQLAGRCARMGDPGCYQEMLCLAHIETKYRDLQQLALLLKPLLAMSPRIRRWLIKTLLRLSQRRGERFHSRLRRAVFLQDDKQRDLLSFSGRSE